jgi:hypothetical protein
LILLLVGIVAVSIGLLRGGRLDGLSKTPLRGGILVVTLFAAQLLARQILPNLLHRADSSIVVWLWCAAAAGLLLVCYLNAGVVGARLLLVGIGLNLLVVALNVGMPVGGALAARFNMIPSGASTSRVASFYRPVDSGTVAPWLGDVIPIPAPRPLRSLGDVFMLMGAAVLLERGVRDGRYRARHSAGR